MFAWTNPLHGDLFPDVRKMEAEVVQMCISMFNGSSQACGTVSYQRKFQMPQCLAYEYIYIMCEQNFIPIPCLALTETSVLEA